MKIEICNAFNSHAGEYERAAKMQNEVGKRLFKRLSYLNIKPCYILDLGCGPGIFSQNLQKFYPAAEVIGIDIAFSMLEYAAKKKVEGMHNFFVNSDMHILPFKSGTFDLIFANQVIHWSESCQQLFRELNRVMKKDGCLMFSTLGPDTFYELASAWRGIDQHSHVNKFIDMHILGDVLLSEYFLDPVVDMEKLSIHFASIKHMLLALKAQGVRNIHPQRNPGLTGRYAWKQFEQALENFCTTDRKFPLTYEVIYGQAWKGENSRLGIGSETRIPIQRLQKRG